MCNIRAPYRLPLSIEPREQEAADESDSEERSESRNRKNPSLASHSRSLSHQQRKWCCDVFVLPKSTQLIV
jgi:hypothetical protein